MNYFGCRTILGIAVFVAMVSSSTVHALCVAGDYNCMQAELQHQRELQQQMEMQRQMQEIREQQERMIREQQRMESEMRYYQNQNQNQGMYQTPYPNF